MKKLLLILLIAFTATLNAQYYAFSKSTGVYSNLVGATILENRNWVVIEKGIKLPFSFKYWGVAVNDSVYLDDWGTLSLDTFYDGEISFLWEDLNSRGAGMSKVSSSLEGVAPNRIFKLEYQNVGFDSDVPLLIDSANMQCWIYETTHVIEFRYGPNSVKMATWADGGAYVTLYDPNTNNVISIENNPANPTVNTTDMNNTAPLVGMPANGLIYKFTPSATGIQNKSVQIKIIQNKILWPALLNVKLISIYNTTGQCIQSVSNADEINLSTLAHGSYIIALTTDTEMVIQKLIL